MKKKADRVSIRYFTNFISKRLKECLATLRNDEKCNLTNSPWEEAESGKFLLSFRLSKSSHLRSFPCRCFHKIFSVRDNLMAFLWVRKNGKIALSGGMELRCFHRRSSKVIRAQKTCYWQQQTVQSKHLWWMPAAANTSCADHFDHSFQSFGSLKHFSNFRAKYDRRAIIEFI